MNDDLIGKVATSIAGRDKGRTFLIVKTEGEKYVYLADGTFRTLAKPKKKKIKHVVLHDAVADAIRDKLKEGKQVFDAEIRKSLSSFNREINDEEGKLV